MSAGFEESHDAIDRALNELAELRSWTGTPKEFWSRYIAALGKLALAAKGVILMRDPNKNGAGWRKVSEWVPSDADWRDLQGFENQLPKIGDRSLRESGYCAPLDGEGANESGQYVIGAPLWLEQREEECVALFLLARSDSVHAQEALCRVRLAGQWAALFHLRQANQAAKADVERFATVLDVVALIQKEDRFLAAAWSFCNELANRYRCERVSLGWLHHGAIRLQAISRTENFNRQMAAAQSLEAAMEEAFDQDEEIVWPPPEGASLITRDHETFAKEQGMDRLCSVPIRHHNEPVAVMTAERNGPAWSETELRQLRLVADLVAKPLAERKAQDRWFGARWAGAARQALSKLVGPEHTWAKVLTLVITGLLAFLIFVPVSYRVEAEAVLRSERVSYLTAPFEGYIDEVAVEPGDRVAEDQLLAGLDTDELRLQESSAIADWDQYRREAEKARADQALAEMRIASAQAAQAKSRLDLVRYRLAQAAIRAPFDGVLVESDLTERIGAPVEQGEELMKIARTDNLYMEAEIHERDVHELNGDETGQMVFVSRPDRKFPIRLARVEPAAVAKDQKNVFVLRCEFEQPPEEWWRPGMSGLCKLDVGRRSLLWILTRRTVDFFRMKLWW